MNSESVHTLPYFEPTKKRRGYPAWREVESMPCPKCGKPMEPVVMEHDSAELPDGYHWCRWVCTECEAVNE